MEALADFRRAVSEVAVAAREDSYTKHTGHNRAIPGPAFAVQGEATETEWAAACAAICDTLAAFPTGCTRAVLISEVAAHLRSDHLRVAGSLSKVVAASRIGKVSCTLKGLTHWAAAVHTLAVCTPRHACVPQCVAWVVLVS